MSNILLDAYYIISVYQKEGKTINSVKLNALLYLADAHCMCIYDDECLYEEGFLVDGFRHI